MYATFYIINKNLEIKKIILTNYIKVQAILHEYKSYLNEIMSKQYIIKCDTINEM